MITPTGIVLRPLPPKCPGCGNSLVSHVPGSAECEEDRHERLVAQSDY